MKHIVALSRTAVIMRHWFEIDLGDASMEHGARIELAPDIVSLGSQFAPDRCSSAQECFERTRDVRGAVQLMISGLRRPDLLDADWVAPWAVADH
jgi:hypothetical protein